MAVTGGEWITVALISFIVFAISFFSLCMETKDLGHTIRSQLKIIIVYSGLFGAIAGVVVVFVACFFHIPT